MKHPRTPHHEDMMKDQFINVFTQARDNAADEAQDEVMQEGTDGLTIFAEAFTLNTIVRQLSELEPYKVCEIFDALTDIH